MKTFLLIFAFPFLFFGSPPDQKYAGIDSPVIKREVRKHLNNGSYEITIRIKKGALSGFASYKETLPANVNAKVTELNLAGSNFKFDQGVIKFLWVSLPGSDELVVSYSMEVDKDMVMDFPGVFKYVDDNTATASTLKSQNIFYSEK